MLNLKEPVRVGFYDIFCDESDDALDKGYKKARDHIYELRDRLFDMITKNSDNSEIYADIMKYVLYLYSGDDFGVTSLTSLEEDLTVSYSVPSEYASIDIIVDTSKNGATQELTKDELIEAISNCFKGTREKNLLANIDSFMYIQSTYKVNAAFAIAVAVQETGAGTTGYGKINNWYNIQNSEGQYTERSSAEESIKEFGELIQGYFNNGQNEIGTIQNSPGHSYCPGENKDWSVPIAGIMESLYKKAGKPIQKGVDGEYSKKSGKISATFETGNMKFNIYDQTYQNWMPGQCNRAACMSIVSGYSKETPELAYSKTKNNIPTANATAYFNQYGLKASLLGNRIDYRPKLRAQLLSGGQALMYIRLGTNGGTYIGKSGKKWTGLYHWIAILGYKVENGKEKIFVSDSGSSGNNARSGWYNIDEFCAVNGGKEILYIYGVNKK